MTLFLDGVLVSSSLLLPPPRFIHHHYYIVSFEGLSLFLLVVLWWRRRRQKPQWSWRRCIGHVGWEWWDVFEWSAPDPLIVVVVRVIVRGSESLQLLPELIAL